MLRKDLLKKLRSYLENHLNPAKKNIIDPRKVNFVQPLSIADILAELQIADVDYYRALYISKDDDFERHLKRRLTSCFVKLFQWWIESMASKYG